MASKKRYKIWSLNFYHEDEVVINSICKLLFDNGFRNVWTSESEYISDKKIPDLSVRSARKFLSNVLNIHYDRL